MGFFIISYYVKVNFCTSCLFNISIRSCRRKKEGKRKIPKPKTYQTFKYLHWRTLEKEES